MSEIVPFTDNLSDLSNQQGYQFEFHCQRCGNGYRSPFQNNVNEQGRGFLRAANSLLAGKLNQVSGAAETPVRWLRNALAARVIHDEAWPDKVRAALSPDRLLTRAGPDGVQ